MDQFIFDKCLLRNNVICCESLIKIKQYLNILQFESCRLSTLQVDCNNLLDKFYVLKVEFEFLVKEAVAVKYFGEVNILYNEYIYEITQFFRKIWQFGKQRFSERAKKAQYISIIGSYLPDVISGVLNFIEDIQNQLIHTPSHSECAATIQSMSAQIYSEILDDCLGSAEACLKQLVYLQSANPFLEALNRLIHQYILLVDVHTPKQFVDKIILKIPSIDGILAQEDSDDMSSFRHIVNLLNGKLLSKDILDQNSDIRPVVEDDINLKKSLTIFKAVQWIMSQYKVSNVQDILMNPTSPIIPLDTINRKYINSSHSLIISPQIIEKFNSSLVYGNPNNSPKKYSPRKLKKNGPSNIEVNNNDLQPINLQSLHTPLLSPLL